MKVGIQTVSWGPRLDALADICGPLHRAGCIGLELSQKPHNLPDGKELAEQFSTNQMLIAGLSGGGISSRMRLRQTGLDFDYLYCDTWSDEMSQLAIATDACIAIHPHVFR